MYVLVVRNHNAIVVCEEYLQMLYLRFPVKEVHSPEILTVFKQLTDDQSTLHFNSWKNCNFIYKIYIDLMYIKILMLMEVLTLYICQMLLFSHPLYLGDMRFEWYALCVTQTVPVQQ